MFVDAEIVQGNAGALQPALHATGGRQGRDAASLVAAEGVLHRVVQRLAIGGPGGKGVGADVVGQAERRARGERPAGRHLMMGERLLMGAPGTQQEAEHNSQSHGESKR